MRFSKSIVVLTNTSIFSKARSRERETRFTLKLLYNH
jgi:hypothetical protein